MPNPTNYNYRDDKFDIHVQKNYFRDMKNYLDQFKDVSANSTPPVNSGDNIIQLNNKQLKKPAELIKELIRCLLFKNGIRLMSLLIISEQYDKENDKLGKNASDIFEFIEKKMGIIENSDELLKFIFPQQKYKSQQQNISKDDCIAQEKECILQIKNNLQFTPKNIKSKISKYFSDIITKFGDDDKSETKENMDCIINKIYDIYKEKYTETGQEEKNIQYIFETFRFTTDENLENDLITVLDQIDCYPIFLYEGIRGFNQFNIYNEEFYSSKMKKFASDSFNVNTEKILYYLKKELAEIGEQEKNKKNEKLQIESIFKSVSIEFELNANYLLLFKILKLNLFTLITKLFIGKLNESYTMNQYDKYFESQKKLFTWTEIASDDIKKTLFLVNIKKNVYDALKIMINSSYEHDFQGVNKEFDTVLRTCVEKLNDFVIQNNLRNNSEVVESLNEYKKRQNDPSTKATGFPMDLILYSDTPPCASAVPTVFRVCSFLM